MTNASDTRLSNQPQPASDVRLIGVGSPIIDVLARVPDAFLTEVAGAKGGMELVESEAIDAILGRIEGDKVHSPGGSAGNTIFALARMGLPVAFLGKVGRDPEGSYYREAFERLGGDASRFKMTDTAPTARCLSLVTPDSERTMRTFLGAAMTLAPEELSAADFEGCTHAHIEGYLLFNPALGERVLQAAKEAGCRVSLDLGSFEVVRAAEDVLPRLLEQYVDVVFANEDEARAYCGHDDHPRQLATFRDLCDTAAVKLGKDGALIARGAQEVHVEARLVDDLLDTTGAGDYWAAGFLYGHAQGLDLRECGRLGAVLGAEVVRHLGAYLEPDVWERVHETIGRAADNGGAHAAAGARTAGAPE